MKLSLKPVTLLAVMAALYVAQTAAAQPLESAKIALGEVSRLEQADAAYDRGDYALAYSIFFPLAEQGNAHAQAKLGQMYGTGHGVELDYAAAVKWSRKAADQGDKRGQVGLAVRYLYGEGVAKDYDKAISLLRKAAEQEDSAAQGYLGSMYERGIGVAKNYATAVSWYRKSADQGLDMGQYRLGYMYENGLGVAKDYATAVIWYRKSAYQGLDVGQYSLGKSYQSGHGVTQDYAAALHWFRKAADQGLDAARYEIAQAYETGRGIKKDKEEALKIYRTLYINGNPRIKDKIVDLACRSEHISAGIGAVAGLLGALADLNDNRPTTAGRAIEGARRDQDQRENEYAVAKCEGDQMKILENMSLNASIDAKNSEKIKIQQQNNNTLESVTTMIIEGRCEDARITALKARNLDLAEKAVRLCKPTERKPN